MRKIDYSDLIWNGYEYEIYAGYPLGHVSLNVEIDNLEQFREITSGISLDRLREICDAEREGRLVVLPCKPNEHWTDEQGEIVVIRIVTDWTGTYVHYRYKGKREVCCCNLTCFAIHFTREEAEAVLRKEQSDAK
jgi:hypothetical protein